MSVLALNVRLTFSQNAIGDAGLISFAEAIRSGALPKLRVLAVDNNPGNTACVKEACESRKIEFYRI
jgi:hypothetical protein